MPKLQEWKSLFPLFFTIFFSLLLQGCMSSGIQTAYDLSAAQAKIRTRLPGQLAIAKPLSISVFNSDKILVKDGRGTISYIPGGQWVDQLPDLIQTRLVHTFENSSNMRSVFKTGAGITADYSLSSDIREFYIDASSGTAVVELSVRLIAERSGTIVKAKVFRAEVPASTHDAGSATHGLNEALSQVMVDIVLWVNGQRTQM